MPAAAAAPPELLARRLLGVWAGIALFAVAFVLYRSMIARSHTYDALTFSSCVAAGGPAYGLLHSHHVLYPWIGVPWLAFERSRGFAGDALEALQTLNGLLGALGVAAMYLAARAAGAGLALAVAAALGLGGSYAWWNSAIEASVRTLGATCLIGAAAAALWGAARGLVWWALAGVLLGVAALGHQTNAMFALPLAGSALAAPGVRWRRRFATAAVVCGTGGLVALAGTWYAGRYGLGIRAPAKIVRWAAGYLNLPGPSAGTPAGPAAAGKPGAPAPARRGPVLHNAFRGRWFPSEKMTQLERAQFGWSRSFLGVTDARFVQGEIPLRALRPLLYSAGWVLAAGLCVAAFLPAGGRLRPALALGLLWLATFVPFFFWWEPGNIQFWVTTIPAVWLLAAVAGRALADLVPAAGAGRVWRAFVPVPYLLVAGSLGWANGTGRVVRDADVRQSSWHVLLETLGAVLKPGDVVVVAGHNAVPVYLGYFSTHEWLSLRTFIGRAPGDGSARCAALRGWISERLDQGKRTYALPEVVSPVAEFRDMVWAPAGITATHWMESFAGFSLVPAPGTDGRRLLEIVRPAAP